MFRATILVRRRPCSRFGERPEVAWPKEKREEATPELRSLSISLHKNPGAAVRIRLREIADFDDWHRGHGVPFPREVVGSCAVSRARHQRDAISHAMVGLNVRAANRWLLARNLTRSIDEHTPAP